MKDNSNASLDALQDIKKMMERSSRVLTLSGWSGVWVGVVALIGAFVAYQIISVVPEGMAEPYRVGDELTKLSCQLIGIAMVVLVVALAGGGYFTWRINSKAGISLWTSSSQKMLLNLLIPIATGGAVCLLLYLKNNSALLAPLTLIFYGLGLVNAGKYTVGDIRYLGYLEILLGLFALAFSGIYVLLFWALGFGVLHIFYGIIMWRKYDSRVHSSIQ